MLSSLFSMTVHSQDVVLQNFVNYQISSIVVKESMLQLEGALFLPLPCWLKRYNLFWIICYLPSSKIYITSFVFLVNFFLKTAALLHCWLHCSCLISFPSIHTSLIMFHFISFSPQSIPFSFTLFGCTHITWSFSQSLTVSFTFQPILSLEINDLRVSLDKFLILDKDIHHLKLNSDSFNTPCLFISKKKYKYQTNIYSE